MVHALGVRHNDATVSCVEARSGVRQTRTGANLDTFLRAEAIHASAATAACCAYISWRQDKADLSLGGGMSFANGAEYLDPRHEPDVLDVCADSAWLSSLPVYPRELSPDYYNHDRWQWEYSVPDPTLFDLFGDRLVPTPMPQSPTQAVGYFEIEGDDLDAMGLFCDADAHQLQLDLLEASKDANMYRAPDIRVYIADQPAEEHNDIQRISSVLTREVFAQIKAESEQVDIRRDARLVVCTRGEGYTISGPERTNWAVQFLVDATEGLQYAAFMHQQQQHGRAVPIHKWKTATLYESAVAAGRLFLRLPAYTPNHAAQQPLHFFSPGTCHHAKLELYRTHLALDTHTPGTEEPQDTVEHRSKTAHNNIICADVSVYFLMHVFPLLFAADPNALKLYNTSNICAAQAQNVLTKTPQDRTTSVMHELDRIAQHYNEKVSEHFIRSEKFIPPGDTGCHVKIVKAPRPWVVMQVLQMRQNANPGMLDRCVSLALSFL